MGTFPRPAPRMVRTASWGRPGSHTHGRELQCAGPSAAVAAGERERGLGRPGTRATGVAVGVLASVPAGQTQRWPRVARPALLRPGRGIQAGRLRPALPLRSFLPGLGETGEARGSGSPRLRFPHIPRLDNCGRLVTGRV